MEFFHRTGAANRSRQRFGFKDDRIKQRDDLTGSDLDAGLDNEALPLLKTGM
jgi:hypothetical protein